MEVKVDKTNPNIWKKMNIQRFFLLVLIIMKWFYLNKKSWSSYVEGLPQLMYLEYDQKRPNISFLKAVIQYTHIVLRKLINYLKKETFTYLFPTTQ